MFNLRRSYRKSSCCKSQRSCMCYSCCRPDVSIAESGKQQVKSSGPERRLRAYQGDILEKSVRREVPN